MFQSRFSIIAHAPAYSRRAWSTTRATGGTFGRITSCAGLCRAMYSGGAMYGSCGGWTDRTAKNGLARPSAVSFARALMYLIRRSVRQSVS